MRPAIQQSEMRSDEPVGFLTAKDRPVPKGPGFLLAIEACSLAYQPQNHKRGKHLFTPAFGSWRLLQKPRLKRQLTRRNQGVTRELVLIAGEQSRRDLAYVALFQHCLVRQSKGRSWHRSLPIFDDYGCLSTRRHGRSFSQNGANLRGPTSRPSNGDSSSKRANPIDAGTSLRSRDLAYHPCGMP